MVDVCVEGRLSQERQPSPPLLLRPQLALPMNSDVTLSECVCVCVCVRLCGNFRPTKGSHSHPLVPPHPRALRGLQPRGVGGRGKGTSSSANLVRRDTWCLMRITHRGVWFEEQGLNVCTLACLLI